MALYDPNEFPAEVTTDFTLADVLAWARTKPADETYDYCDRNNCAVARFGRETGRHYLIGMGLPPSFLRRFVNNDDMTFGALVARLESALA